MAILPTDGDAAAGCPRGLGDQGRGRANENVDVRLSLDAVAAIDSISREVGPQAVHFPISGDQRPHRLFRQ